MNKEFLIQKYVIEKLSTYKVGKLVNCSGSVIWYYLKKYNIEPRNRYESLKTSNINENYFKCYTSNMAYILGFIVSDGNLSKTDNCLSFCVARKDRNILEFIQKEISPDSKIYDYDRYTESGKLSNISKLNIINKIIYNDLLSLGVEPKKTGKEIVPNIPDELLYDYLRGAFDGDGTIGFYQYDKQVKCNFSLFSACREYLIKLFDKINVKYGIIRTRSKNRKVPVYCWNLTHHKYIIDLCSLIYDKENFCLQRKKDIFLNIRHYFS